ncbi:hypothetical protein [Aeromicrobium sp. CTD01-1L150]|uniref:hypothetical protein n=1 Tax=Aeromicrobium sp. CTD01-1L150 TaxID=3341830 RepID=UPI0035BFD0D8
MSTPVPRGTFKRSCQSCGWSGRYETAGRADYAKRRHSCQKYQAKAAARQRGEDRRAAVDRTPKPCRHKVAQHVHGTYACYTLDRCRCTPCSSANAEYESERTRQQAYGRWDNYVDAEPSRRHVSALMDQGMGLKRIVVVSGISQGLLWKLVYGKRRPDGTRVPSKRVRRDTEVRLLALEVDLADGARISAVGTRRRLQALVAIGYSQSNLARRLSMLASNFGPLLHDRREVTVATAQRVRDLYDELAMHPNEPTEWHEKAAASRARQYAARMVWLPPLAWDDELIDDPSAQPADTTGLLDQGLDLDDVAIERAMGGDRSVVRGLSFDERVDLVRRWRETGEPLNELERRTGLNARRYFVDEEEETAA